MNFWQTFPYHWADIEDTERQVRKAKKDETVLGSTKRGNVRKKKVFSEVERENVFPFHFLAPKIGTTKLFFALKLLYLTVISNYGNDRDNSSSRCLSKPGNGRRKHEQHLVHRQRKY